MPLTTAGLIVGAYGLLQTILRLPTGVLGSRSSFSRLIMVSGALILSISSFMLLMVKTASLLWCARALAGVSAATWVCFSVFYGQAFSNDDKRSMGYMVSANNLGMMLGYIFAAIFNDILGIEFLFAASAVAAAMAGILLIVLFRDMPSQGCTAGASLSDVGAVLKNGRIWSCSLLTALSQLISFATMISFSANYAVSTGCTGAQVGMISVVNTVAGLIASSLIASGKLEFVPQKWLVSLGFVLMLIYCIFLPKCLGIDGLLILQFLGGIGRTFIMTTMMAGTISGIAPVQKTMAMGIFQSVYGLGMTLGPILMGWLLDETSGYSSAFSVVAAICLAGAASALILKTENKRAEHAM